VATKAKDVVTKGRVFGGKERHYGDALLRLRKRLLTYRELEECLLYNVHNTRNGNEVL
jgi:hypothetical protein